MKKIINILIISFILFSACSDDFELNDNDQNLNVDFLPGKYVAFAAAGVNTSQPPGDYIEGDTGVNVFVEIPTGTESNVTVNYEFGGTAVFGTDFIVEGATSSGGSVTIIPDPNAPDPADLVDNAAIVVDFLEDGVLDGEKQLVITLVSASNAEGEVLVGRAGTDLLKSRTIIIDDID